jgi:hypothetical protein
MFLLTSTGVITQSVQYIHVLVKASNSGTDHLEPVQFLIRALTKTIVDTSRNNLISSLGLMEVASGY